MKSNLRIRIGKIWASSLGTIENLELDVPLDFDPEEIDAISNLKADIMLVKLKHELSVIMRDVEVLVKLNCQRCLESYEYEIEIPSAEREFQDAMPKEETDQSDIFLINLKDLTIDLTDMIRQEIILHFPLISVCSNTHATKRSASTTECKGLCPQCGINKNKKSCKCREEDPTTQKPFKNLKKLIN